MKFKILQEDLSKALNIASRFTSSRVQLPILANILLTARKNKLTISATNLETSISLSIGSKIDNQGEITVPSRTLNDLISNLNPGQIDLESDKEQLKVKTSGFKSLISGMNSSDFPSVPSTIDKKSLKIPFDEFSNCLSKVLFAVSTDETRPVLTGVLLIITKDIVLVATDGFRLSQKKLTLKKVKQLRTQRIILPKNVLSELLRIASSEETINFSYQKDQSQVVFGVDSVVLSSRIIEGEFPDFEKIIPKDAKIKLSLDKEEFLQAVKLASVFARDSANVVKILVKADEIVVSAESKQAGSQKTSVDAKVEGLTSSNKDFKIAFNYRFLEDFLNSVEGENVEVQLSDPNAPALFLDIKDKNYLHIIMPVKLQG